MVFSCECGKIYKYKKNYDNHIIISKHDDEYKHVAQCGEFVHWGEIREHSFHCHKCNEIMNLDCKCSICSPDYFIIK